MSRSLSAIGVLERSLEAGHLAQHALLYAILQREGPIVLPEEALPEGITRQVLSEPTVLEDEPFQGLTMQEVRVEISWMFRNQPRTTQLTTTLPPE